MCSDYLSWYKLMTVLEKIIEKIRKSKKKVRLPRKVRSKVAQQKKTTKAFGQYPSIIGSIGAVAGAFSLYLISQVYNMADDRADQTKKLYESIHAIDSAQCEFIHTNTSRLIRMQAELKEVEGKLLIMQKQLDDLQKTPPPKTEDPPKKVTPKKSGWIHIPERRGNYLRY